MRHFAKIRTLSVCTAQRRQLAILVLARQPCLRIETGDCGALPQIRRPTVTSTTILSHPNILVGFCCPLVELCGGWGARRTKLKNAMDGDIVLQIKQRNKKQMITTTTTTTTTATTNKNSITIIILLQPFQQTNQQTIHQNF